MTSQMRPSAGMRNNEFQRIPAQVGNMVEDSLSVNEVLGGDLPTADQLRGAIGGIGIAGLVVSDPEAIIPSPSPKRMPVGDPITEKTISAIHNVWD